MPERLIAARGLQSYYGASHVLRGVDFHVDRGETIGLMGRNGMGKSTLLKSLMGLVRPREGTVEVKGRDMVGHPSYEVAQLGIAYVPEGRGIFANLSVKENLVMAARPGTAGQRDWTYERVLDTFPRLKERLGHGGQQLSGGEQQMLTIGRALMTNPDLILIDEATEGLAPMIAESIWTTLRTIRGQGVATLVVDKDFRALSRLADRVLLMTKGELVFEGTPAALQATPELLEKHLGI